MKDLKKLTHFIRFLRRIAISIPPIIFGYLRLKGIDIAPIDTDFMADLLFKITLVVFYFSWAFGTMFDLNMQDLVYEKTLKKSVMSKKVGAIVFTILLLAVFCILFLADTYRKFAIILAIFLIVDCSCRYYIAKFFVPDIINESYNKYLENKEYSNYLMLQIVEKYVTGKWHIWRFSIGFILISIILIMTVFDLQIIIARLLDLNSPSLVCSLSIFIFVVIFLGWQWCQRFKVKAQLALAQSIEDKYKFEPLNP